MYLIGYDIGSSSVKACVVDAQTGKTLSTAFYPKQEAPILSLKAGWAEQEPESWWNYLKSATAEAMAATAEKAVRPVSALKEGLAAIGISYQMPCARPSSGATPGLSPTGKKPWKRWAQTFA